MRHLVVLCRHGNTFNAGEKVVMVGAREDLPLTEAGYAQADVVADALRSASLVPARVYAGPLRRTSEFARRIIERLGFNKGAAIDPRLTELDYGEWSGLSDHEIAERWGASVLEAWQLRGVRPQGVRFYPSEVELESEVRSLLKELQSGQGLSLVISSNGRLREFGRQVSQGDEAGALKVRTGKVCVLEFVNDLWRILWWDAEPMRLMELTSSE
jgi:broad specificity phosphatase PhoE